MDPKLLKSMRYVPGNNYSDTSSDDKEEVNVLKRKMASISSEEKEEVTV
jgi:hypothetical protein